MLSAYRDDNGIRNWHTTTRLNGDTQIAIGETSWFSSGPPDNLRYSTSNEASKASFRILSISSFTRHPIVGRRNVWAESVVNQNKNTSK